MVRGRKPEYSWDDFPYCKNEEGKPLCRKCGVVLTGRKTAWCSQACVNEVRLLTDWRYIRSKIRRRDKYRCVLCGQPATDVDHIVELADGGSWHDFANLRSLCGGCHKKKTNEMRKIRAAKKKQEKLDAKTKGICSE